MSMPLNKRDFDIFLSHAHKDERFVSELYYWLTAKAGFRVWYDAHELPGGAMLATDLQKAIERCRSILLVASEESVSRGWVKNEYNSAMDEHAKDSNFRVVALKIAGANTKELMKGITWIDAPELKLDIQTTQALIRACYPGENIPNPVTARDVFISRSWHGDDNASAQAVCQALAEQGFRLIGDAKDQQGFGGGNRVERIIASCGAFVGIIPYRNEPHARTSQGAYKYFMQEIEFATKLALPCIIISDHRVSLEDGSDQMWLRMDTNDSNCSTSIGLALQTLWENWVPPPQPQYIFLAMDLDSKAASPGGPIRNLIERITGMPTIVGNEVFGSRIQSAIRDKICDAFVVIADITDDNLNTCIEAGMALARDTNLELLTCGKPRRPPFMLRDLQMLAYEDDIERVGIIHNIARRYRRRIINAEL